MPGFDLKHVSRNDQGILGAGVVFFLLSFFIPFYGYSGPSFGGLGNYNVTAWHSYGWLGVLLIIAAAGLVAARVFGNVKLPTLPVGPNLLVAGLAALGTLILLLRGFTYKTASGGGASIGLKWGAYIDFILAVVVVVFAVLNFRASGEKLAWDQTAMPKGASAATTPPVAPYPPAGSAPSYPPAAPPSQSASFPSDSTGDAGAPTV
jgi:hypothetical protein